MEDKTLIQILIDLHIKYPNDMVLGAEVRKLIWQHIENINPPY